MGDSRTPYRDPAVVGILNLSPESFSDGHRVADAEVAEARARAMLAGGAAWVELGAASSHPDAAEISEDEEIARLRPLLTRLSDVVGRVGVDTWKPGVQRFCLSAGVGVLNDVNAFSHRELYPVLAGSRCRLVAMHSVQSSGKAARQHGNAATIVDEIVAFFRERLAVLREAGIDGDRLWVDPGMGFFLGDGPEPSIAVLRALDWLRSQLQAPLLLSVSRKSFLGTITGREIERRGPATLSAELFAADSGVDALRTHDVDALIDALAVRRALRGE
jgi:dihydropteroate synthase type 2